MRDATFRAPLHSDALSRAIGPQETLMKRVRLFRARCLFLLSPFDIMLGECPAPRPTDAEQEWMPAFLRQYGRVYHPQHAQLLHFRTPLEVMHASVSFFACQTRPLSGTRRTRKFLRSLKKMLLTGQAAGAGSVSTRRTHPNTT